MSYFDIDKIAAKIVKKHFTDERGFLEYGKVVYHIMFEYIGRGDVEISIPELSIEESVNIYGLLNDDDDDDD